MKKGKFIVISGPSGVGKDTICDELVKSGIGVYSVSMTTREIRKGEVDGKDYFFVTKEVFEDKIKNNYFLEYAIYNNNYYGTPIEFVENTTNNGINVFAILEINGAINVKKIFKDAILIFIMPPSLDELEKRLRGRKSDSDEVINERLDIAKSEISSKDKYDYIVFNNSVDEAVKEIKNIIDKIS